MVLSLPAALPVPLWAIGIAIGVFIIMGAVSFFVLLFASQIPFAAQQIKGQMKRTAAVMTHYSHNRAEIYCPKRAGKDEHENTLTLPPSMGAKFDPSGSNVAESFDKSTLYHYYTKATSAMLPKHAKAVQDFIEFCKTKGIPITKPLIDVLVIEDCDIKGVYTEPMLERIMKELPLQIRTEKEQWLDEELLESKFQQLEAHLNDLQSTDTSIFKTDDELGAYNTELEETKEALKFVELKRADFEELGDLKSQVRINQTGIEDLKERNDKLIDEIDILTGYLDPETRETIYTIKRLQEDLKKLVIKEGTFVFSTVHDFVFSASALNSSGVTEAINIAKSDALEQNRKDDRGFTMQALFAGVIIIVVLFFGLGIAYKVGFGA